MNPIADAAATAAAPTPLTYFLQSNLSGQAIVVVLVLCSLVAWTTMFGKSLQLSRLRASNREVEDRLARLPALLDEVGVMRAVARGGPYARLVRAAIEAYRRAEGVTPTAAGRLAFAENALQRTVSEVTVHYETRMVLLASIVSGAPFLGLLGTVWGVMDAFGAIALRSSATLQSLAPGVSGALLTTVAGLLVAIPSVFGYNFLLTQVKIMVTELENFASALADRLELEAHSREAQNPES